MFANSLLGVFAPEILPRVDNMDLVVSNDSDIKPHKKEITDRNADYGAFRN